VWIGTREGLSLYNPRQTQFAHYRHDAQDPHSLAGDRVWGLDGDDTTGSLWVGTGGGLDRFDLDTGEVTHQQLEAASLDPADRSTGVIYADPLGGIWVGVGSSLYQFDRTSGDVTAYDLQTLQASDAPLVTINSIHRQGSTLWIGSLGSGLIRFDLQTGQFETAFEPPLDLVGQGDPRFLLSHGISMVYGDRDGTLWIGYSSGELSHLDPETGTLRHYLPDAEDPHAISSGSITDIYQDQSGILWLASRRGLTRFDPQEETFTLYTESDGLPSPYVTGIQEDQEGILWLATVEGISRFDPPTRAGEIPQTGLFQSYDAADGVGSIEFLGPSWQSADGRIFFGGKEGLTAFYPDQVTPSAYEPPVVLTRLHLFREPVDVEEGGLLEQPIWVTDELTLQPDQLFVSFEFAALSYTAPQKIRYRYILEGLDETWTETGSDHRLATYTHLPAGEYVFRVQGTNSSGIWSPHEASLALTVLPPWWETWWFRVALVGLIVGFVAAGVRWRVSALQRRSRVLETEVAARTARLRESEERFATVMNSMEALMYVADMETYELLFVNQTVRDTFGDVEGAICWQVLQKDQTGPCDFCTNEHLLKDGRPTGVSTWEFQNPVTGRWYFMQDRAIRWTDGRWVRLEVATDITERKQLEAQSQRIAVMEERERIGRELHDDLGQVMGYVSVQAQAALERLGQEEPEQVRAILHQLVQAASEAHDDVRQYILGVRTRAPSPPQNLFAALEEYLNILRQRYGLTVQVSWPEDLLESPLAPEVETQLLRITQEALTNVRKHAGVDTARLLFTVHPEGVQVIIEDDGCGFELGGGDVRVDVSDATGRGFDSIEHPEKTSLTLTPPSPSFGLQIMRERAESVGGNLEVRSAPGEGTRIIVRLPSALNQPDPGQFGNGLRVLLVDDHPLYLEGLRGLLASRGVQVVGEAHDGLEAQAQAQTLRPDLILMDVQMPRCDGVEATRRIKAELPHIQIVMLTMAADDETLFEALKAGASGYLLKNLAGAQFFALLRQVMAGEHVISPALASRVLVAFTQQGGDAEEEEEVILTARQREVLELVAQGLTNQEVADALHVTEATVKYHVSQILERLELKSRHQLSRYVEGG
jgi:PAS domain S-box-containing protein